MEIISVQVCKAAPIIEAEPVADGVINICGELPEYETLELAELNYKAEAQKIFDVLFNTLPRGTRHQLMILMLQNTVELYKGNK